MRVRVLLASYRSSPFIEVLRDESCVTFLDPMYQWMNGAGYPLTALQLTVVCIPSCRFLGVVMLTSSGGPLHRIEIYGYGKASMSQIVIL